MSWRGGCKCGEVSFEATGEIAKLMECNCSICRPKGYLHWFVPEASFRLEMPRMFAYIAFAVAIALVLNMVTSALEQRARRR